MITDYQKELLAAAATMDRELEEGFNIASIFIVAMGVGDDDTCDYIAEHYATLDHFTQDELDVIEQIKLEMAIGEPVGHA